MTAGVFRQFPFSRPGPWFCRFPSRLLLFWPGLPRFSIKTSAEAPLYLVGERCVPGQSGYGPFPVPFLVFFPVFSFVLSRFLALPVSEGVVRVLQTPHVPRQIEEQSRWT